MAFRLGVSLLLFAILFYLVDFWELVSALKEVDPLSVFYLLVLSVVMIWASCLKWLLFVRAAGHEVSILSLMNLYTIGYFFNSFFPSFVGGDVARSFHLGKYLGSQRDAFVSTFLERITGLLAMSFLGVSFVLFGTEVTTGVEIAILLVGVGALCLALACFSVRVRELLLGLAAAILNTLPQGFWVDKLQGLFVKVGEGLESVGKAPFLFWKAMGLSLVFHMLAVVNTYVAAQAVGWENPDFAGLFVVVPLVLLVSMLPITPSGLGVQEGAFYFFLKRIGAESGQALGVGVILRAKVILIALVGWILWLRLRDGTAEAAT